MSTYDHNVAVLNKAALDAASELDCLKNIAAIDETERQRIAALVSRIYDASEQLYPIKEPA